MLTDTRLRLRRAEEKAIKLAYSTPTRPLELPPFSLLPLLQPVFSLSSSRPTSPSKQPLASPPSSRFGQLVSTVAAGAGAAAAAATGADGGSGGGGASHKQLTVRALEAGDQRVWVAANDGRVRLYEVSDEAGELNASPGPLFGPLSPPGSPPSAGRRTPVKPPSVLDLVDEVYPTTAKKAVDRIALLPQVDKAVILSEGQLTFHSLPLLAALPASSFPTIKGVMSFALDEDELAAGVNDADEEGQGEGKKGMHLVVIKRKTVHWLRVTKDGLERIKDLPLRGGALLSLLRHSRICIADAENYSIIDLDAAEALPLLPISQEPHPEPLPPPPSAVSTSSASAAGGEDTASGAVTPPPPPGAPDPRHRPAIACVAESEFLIASHTGTTTLGVFVNEGGEPSRGTVEWASNVRSLVVDPQYTVALLSNNTLEVHSLSSLEIVQVVTLPSSPSPSSSISTFQPRALHKSWLGLELGAATGAAKLEIVEVPLLPSTSSSSSNPPSTPPRRQSRSSSLAASLTPSIRSSTPGHPTTTRIILQGRNGLFALTPLTLAVQVDALLDRGREADAEKLVEEFEEGLSKSGGQRGGMEALELSYAHLRLFFLSLRTLSFQSAFDHFLSSGCDPRVAIRMFEELPGRELMGEGERVDVVRGVEGEIRRGRTMDEYILDNLNRHYSPHIQPSVESAPSTVELRESLAFVAREGLIGYLTKWRERRRSGQMHAGDSRKVDMVVDTSLIALLSSLSASRLTAPSEITTFLSSSNDAVLPLIAPSLLSCGLHGLLADLWLKKGEVGRALEVWKGVAEHEEEKGTGGREAAVGKVFELVWERVREKEEVEKWGLWVLRLDQARGLKLFTDPRQTFTFDTRDLFAKMSAVDPFAADMFLESTVLQERDMDSRLHADLVKRYIGRLGELLAEPDAKAHLRQQESDYHSLPSSSTAPPTFLSFLTTSYDTSSPHALLDRVRLKALIFLACSSKYDISGAKKELEAMEVKGLRGLTLERVVVYGKLHLDRQALSLLLHTLRDLPTAEAYSLQSGDPLSSTDVSAAAAKLELPFSKRPRRQPSQSSAKREEEERRRREVARLLVEMCLAKSPSGEEEKPVASEGQIARLLETQAIHLDTLEILPLLPSAYPLNLLTPYLSRSLLRSLHAQQEASILKSLAASQNMDVTAKLWEVQKKVGPVVDLTGTASSENGPGGGEKEKKGIRVGEGEGKTAGAGRGEVGGEKALTVPPGGVLSLDDAVELDLP
ncbi:hypothetical protein JCM11251_006058 [Rhodosporidiobolus azoricus]